VILWRRIQEEVQQEGGQSEGKNLQGGELTARVRRGDSRSPVDRQIVEKLRRV
jgi:hypothetical protein